MRRRGFFIGFDFPFGFYMHRGPFRMFRPFPRRDEYLRMLEEYKRDLEEELREVEQELEELRRGA